MVAAFGTATRSQGQVSHTKIAGERDHPIYVAKDYGTFCVVDIGKLCNSCSGFQSVAQGVHLKLRLYIRVSAF